MSLARRLKIIKSKGQIFFTVNSFYPIYSKRLQFFTFYGYRLNFGPFYAYRLTPLRPSINCGKLKTQSSSEHQIKFSVMVHDNRHEYRDIPWPLCVTVIMNPLPNFQSYFRRCLALVTQWRPLHNGDRKKLKGWAVLSIFSAYYSFLVPIKSHLCMILKKAIVYDFSKKLLSLNSLEVNKLTTNGKI